MPRQNPPRGSPNARTGGASPRSQHPHTITAHAEAVTEAPESRTVTRFFLRARPCFNYAEKPSFTHTCPVPPSDVPLPRQKPVTGLSEHQTGVSAWPVTPFPVSRARACGYSSPYPPYPLHIYLTVFISVLLWSYIPCLSVSVPVGISCLYLPDRVRA